MHLIGRSVCPSPRRQGRAADQPLLRYDLLINMSVTMPTEIIFQRLEGAAIAAAATIIYFHQGLPWWLFLLALFAFDVSMIGYLAGPRVGAKVYNLGHSLIGPAITATQVALTGSPFWLGVTCLWVAHIGLDRALGYGLKRESGFGDTHLGKIGKMR
jgi:hypothetical protein